MTFAILTLAALLTSLVSGIFSMAGGMILMGVFGFLLTVPQAMILHGITQTASNGSRIWLYRKQIRWSVLAPYVVGALLCLAAFYLVAFIPGKGLIFLVIGTFPFAALRLPSSVRLDMTRRPVAFACGVVITLVQLLAGASGPLLDVFFVDSKLNRFEILGTKAITQTFSHLLKLFYYAFLVSVTVDLPLFIYPLVVAAAIAGNSIGKIVTTRMTDDQFRIIGRYIIQTIGVIYIGKGIYELVTKGAGAL